MNNEIFYKCVNEDKEHIQVAGLKLPVPTDVSITNLDESVCIKYTDPNDIDLNGAPLAEYDGTIIVRKVGSAPKHNTDGIIVSDSKIRNQYKDEGFIDTGLVNGTEYYYGIFPYTLDGVYNFKCNQSIIPEAIYPDAPVSVKVYPRNSKLKINFVLPENATGVKICYSTTRPESNEVPYGSMISNVESPCTISDLVNDTTYYVTVYSTNEKDRCVPYTLIEATPREAELYEFMIDDNESDPDSRVTYIGDTIGMTPAYMDYDNDTFNYGSWADAFFMKVKPCMLKYSGEVDYYLNPNNVEYKEDGVTPSDVANIDYDGNAMVEFPKIFYKIVDNGNNTGTISICDMKLDDDYKCYSNIDSKNNEIDHFYMPMYDGSLINGKLRSLSSQKPMNKQNRQAEVNYAKANNIVEDIIWYTSVICDRLLIQLLLTLISKSTDSQSKFGTGNCNGGDSVISGTLNNKGLFYGKNDQVACVKVFGIENFWGNIIRSIAGWVSDNGVQKIKMTYSTYDGSTVEGYNLDGSGYITVPGCTPSGTNGGYISGMKFVKYGLIPIEYKATSSTHYCDSCIIGSSYAYALCGGGSSLVDYINGAFYTILDRDTTVTDWNSGASLSCKPLAATA